MDNIRKDLREIEWNDKDWIHLIQYRDQLRAPVNMVLIPLFHKMLENS